MKNYKHISIAGNIGAGKTTLTKILADKFNWTPNFEEVTKNPYINDFYEDMKHWSFHMQIFYLNKRYQQILDIRREKGTIIQDRTIYEDAYIFAPNLHHMGLMSKRDFETYSELFDTIKPYIQSPDLLIYLKASPQKLLSQIKQRGREFENQIREDYLVSLNKLYNNWIDHYDESKLIIVNIDNVDFMSEDGLNYISKMIKGEI